MNTAEKLLLGATALFALLCMGVLLLRTLPAPAVETERTAVYTPEALDTRSERDRLNEILGIEEAETPPDTAGRLNINTADAEALQTLPGIGPVLAERIVSYREANGPFQNVSHLKDVTGIGDGVYAKIADLIYAG